MKKLSAGSVSLLLLCGLISSIGCDRILQIVLPSRGPIDWNDSQVAWFPHEQGLRLAKASDQPICVVLYADWCPYCHEASDLFRDPYIVEAAKQFVLVKINVDAEEKLDRRYRGDGGYIPRILFLSPTGEIDFGLVNQRRRKDVYTYSEDDVRSLWETMQQAIAKYSSRPQ